MVKLLAVPPLENLNASLHCIDFGDHSICGRLGAYSLKMVQKDKKLVKHLQREYSNEKMKEHHINKHRNVNPEQIDDSLEKLAHVPVGNLHEFSTIRLISYFISTLNTTYHDFDFTNSEPNQFKTEKSEIVNQTINARLTPLAKSKPLLMESFWKNINSFMDLQQCHFYSFTPTDDIMTALRPNSLWNLDYFIVNQSSRQLLYLSLHAKSNLRVSGSDEFKDDMELDLEEDSVNDDMAWCDPEEMSPRSELKNRRNGNNHNHNDHRNHNHLSTGTPVIDLAMDNETAYDSDVLIIGDNLDEVRSRKMQQPRSMKNEKTKQRTSVKSQPLHVINMDNCLSQMPALERPSDL